MAVGWDKPWKVVADAAPGFASVNRFQDNLQWAYETMASEHGIIESQDFRDYTAYPARTVQLGHHSTQKIPRAVLSLTVQQISMSITLPQLVTPDQHVKSYLRLASGAFFFEIVGLTTFWARAEPNVSSTSVVRWCPCRTDLGTTYTGSKPGIWVDTLTLGGGVFASADYDFRVFVYGA